MTYIGSILARFEILATPPIGLVIKSSERVAGSRSLAGESDAR
jgi:hypothetical protein